MQGVQYNPTFYPMRARSPRLQAPKSENTCLTA
jgi:hypothetical protein